MRVVLFGASGMVGRGVLLECLNASQVESVLAVGRSPVGFAHPKLREVIHDDFFDYTSITTALTGRDACFFCLGVSSVGMHEDRYHRLTYELTMAAAETLLKLNPGMVFCYVSGTGTDSSEKGRRMWARVKGKTENHLLRMPFKASFMFRPGYIQPVKGVRSKTGWYQLAYTVLGPLYPVFKALIPNYVTTTENVGLAMISVVSDGYSKRLLENRDINALAARTDR